MDALDSVVDPLREFAKDSLRLVKRCHKPDRKGEFAINFPIVFVDSVGARCFSVVDIFVYIFCILMDLHGSTSQSSLRLQSGLRLASL